MIPAHCPPVIRGLLCRDCNRALGLLGDDLAAVEAALVYLRPSPIRKAG